MKLRNKKTGEIGYLHSDSDNQVQVARNSGYNYRYYNSLAELLEEWEDAPEEPKEHWAIDQFGEPINVSGLSRLQLEKLHRLGNDFPSENATMKAIEKIKAWKRLKDKGFKFQGWSSIDGISYKVSDDFYDSNDLIPRDIRDDLDLLFGDEE